MKIEINRNQVNSLRNIVGHYMPDELQHLKDCLADGGCVAGHIASDLMQLHMLLQLIETGQREDRIS